MDNRPTKSQQCTENMSLIQKYGEKYGQPNCGSIEDDPLIGINVLIPRNSSNRWHFSSIHDEDEGSCFSGRCCYTAVMPPLAERLNNGASAPGFTSAPGFAISHDGNNNGCNGPRLELTRQSESSLLPPGFRHRLPNAPNSVMNMYNEWYALERFKDFPGAGGINKKALGDDHGHKHSRNIIQGNVADKRNNAFAGIPVDATAAILPTTSNVFAGIDMDAIATDPTTNVQSMNV
ncbi:hypothetical protein IV203_001665 [Nitzschia inconspicua]|uniref:Uncharacterized protein n=1 Tax=Nitzschia inconspicua TaxID=303405 RepID=A0A9K3L7C8_9STRA|nr:hypothetical protein IV203_001665 [Nitzschia inconspicua]